MFRYSIKGFQTSSVLHLRQLFRCSAHIQEKETTKRSLDVSSSALLINHRHSSCIITVSVVFNLLQDMNIHFCLLRIVVLQLFFTESSSKGDAWCSGRVLLLLLYFLGVLISLECPLYASIASQIQQSDYAAINWNVKHMFSFVTLYLPNWFLPTPHPLTHTHTYTHINTHTHKQQSSRTLRLLNATMFADKLMEAESSLFFREKAPYRSLSPSVNEIYAEIEQSISQCILIFRYIKAALCLIYQKEQNTLRSRFWK